MTQNTTLLKDVENTVFIPEEKRLDDAIDAAVADGFSGSAIRGPEFVKACVIRGWCAVAGTRRCSGSRSVLVAESASKK